MEVKEFKMNTVKMKPAKIGIPSYHTQNQEKLRMLRRSSENDVASEFIHV